MDPIPKVLAYITCKRQNRLELLVFEHVGQPDAGLQVPAGTIDRKETAADAILREVKEESGLIFTKEPTQIGLLHYYHIDKNEYHLRHIFQFMVPPDLPAEWTHTVTGKGRDKNLQFRFFWIPLDSAASKLAANQGSYSHLVRS